jgi:hypothetical protein
MTGFVSTAFRAPCTVIIIGRPCASHSPGANTTTAMWSGGSSTTSSTANRCWSGGFATPAAATPWSGFWGGWAQATSTRRRDCCSRRTRTWVTAPGSTYAPSTPTLYCGTIAVQIQRDGDEIVWRDPADASPDGGEQELIPMRSTPVGYNSIRARRRLWPWPSRPRGHVGAEVCRDGYQDWPELRFDAAEYRAAITHRPAPLPTSR